MSFQETFMVGISLYSFDNFALVENDALLANVEWVHCQVQFDGSTQIIIQQNVLPNLNLLAETFADLIRASKKGNPPRYIAINDVVASRFALGFEIDIPQRLDAFAFRPALYAITEPIANTNLHRAIIGFEYCLIQ